MYPFQTDVLVVGGGGSGCRAAIEAADNGAKVILLVKGTLGNSETHPLGGHKLRGGASWQSQ